MNDIVDIEKGELLSKQPLTINQLKNERNLMLYPFCSTSKATRFSPIKYKSKDGKFSLEVTANAEYGMAKIWDFDILRFVFSKIDTIAKRTGYTPSSVSFSAYECLKFLKREPGAGKNIKWLKEALDRLASTTYKSNLFKHKTTTIVAFTLIKYSYEETSKGMDKIVIQLDDRLMNSIQETASLESFNHRLLCESSGLKKRLLELVALMVDSSGAWIVSVSELKDLCANSWAIPKFKSEIKSFNDLPWTVAEVKTEDESFIRFIEKK